MTGWVNDQQPYGRADWSRVLYKGKLCGTIPTFQYLGHWMPCQTEIYCKDKTDQAPLNKFKIKQLADKVKVVSSSLFLISLSPIPNDIQDYE